MVAGAVVLGVLVAGFYFFLPLLVEVFVARNLQDELGLDSAPEVEVRGNPVRMLAGKFGGGRVVLPGYRADGVRTRQVEADLAPFDLDVLGSLTGGQLVFEQPLSGTLRAVLPEDEVARIAAWRAAGFPVRDVELEEELVTAQIEISAFGQSVPVAVEGGVSVMDGAVVFEPGNIEAGGMPVPPELARSLLQGTGFVYPVGGLPPGVRVTGAEVERNLLVLTGEVTALPRATARSRDRPSA